MAKLLIIDVDGVMTNGTKVYDEYGKIVYKSFHDYDKTAIRRFKAAEWNVCALTADPFNKGFLQSINVDFYITEEDKSPLLPILQERYQISLEDIYFIGDSYFDLSFFELIPEGNRYCPLSAEYCVGSVVPPRNVISRNGGTGILEVLFELLGGRA